jgi:hypothetical protein
MNLGWQQGWGVAKVQKSVPEQRFTQQHAHPLPSSPTFRRTLSAAGTLLLLPLLQSGSLIAQDIRPERPTPRREYSL